MEREKMPVDSAQSHSGAHYYSDGDQDKFIAPDEDSYYFETYIGSHSIRVDRGDCVFWLESGKTMARLTRGPAQVQSPHFATLIRGYAPENRSCEFSESTVLPYVNGCSTKQIFAPERPGDPTMQMLKIPPFASEQVHHIHSTVRSVYVLSGKGTSVVGMQGKTKRSALLPGMICVLEKMCPHHFETEDSPLVVIPVHVWSTQPGVENNHPMFNGTFKT